VGRDGDLDGPSELARSFLDKSIGQRRRRTWLLRTAVAFYLVLALVAGVVAVIASEQRDNAQYADVVAQADRLEVSDPSLAAQLYLVAHHRRPDDRDVIGRVLSTQNAPLGRPLPGHAGAIYFTGFSPDGRTLAPRTNDTPSAVEPHTSAARAPGKPLDAGTQWVSAAAFSRTAAFWQHEQATAPSTVGCHRSGEPGEVDGAGVSGQRAAQRRVLVDSTRPMTFDRLGAC